MSAAASVRVGRLSLTLPHRGAEARARALVEDGLRTASLPARACVVIRRLDLGVLESARGGVAVARRVEDAWRQVLARVGAAGWSDDRTAVFASSTAAWSALVEAVSSAGGGPLPWFAAALVPELARTSGVGPRLAAVVRSAAAGQGPSASRGPGAGGIAVVVRAVAAERQLAPLLDALDDAAAGRLVAVLGFGSAATVERDRDGRDPDEAGASDRGPESVARGVERIGLPSACLEVLAAASESLARRMLAAGFGLVVVDPRWVDARRAASVVAQLVRRHAAPREGSASGVGEPDPGRPGGSRRSLGPDHDGRAVRSSADLLPADLATAREARRERGAPQRGSRRAESATSGAGPRELVEESPEAATDWAGLVFAIPLLESLGIGSLGIGAAVDRGVLPPSTGARVLVRLAGRHGDDPAVRYWSELVDDGFLDATSSGTFPRAELDAAVRSLVARVAGRLRRIDPRPRRLLRKPGLFAADRTHVDVSLPLDAVDIRLRRAGLDLSPGWVPWLGRVVAIHYRSRRELERRGLPPEVG